MGRIPALQLELGINMGQSCGKNVRRVKRPDEGVHRDDGKARRQEVQEIVPKEIQRRSDGPMEKRKNANRRDQHAQRCRDGKPTRKQQTDEDPQQRQRK